MQTFSLAIIEDQAPIREALSEYLCEQPEFRCELVVDSMEAFLSGLDTVAEPPQLILSDIGLPGRTGIEGLPLIHARLPGAQVLMLSVYADAERVYEALCAGAVGYLLKNTPLVQLKEHLLQVAAGGSPMSPGVARHVVQAFQRMAARPVQQAAAARSTEPLTARELEVVRGIEDGLSYKLIADRHHISLDTVRNHIRAVYRKLQVNSKGELMAHALRRQQH
ncbi:response regulator transcription factor [Hymenobacter sp. ASUV-10]|uniref:Response regulator transcription factor n=1 Tax=Hymenobacter aranciens TaxID=3063996 RepID=A0ABT9BFB3_9BACT|nr:response regulator transcription factor [Hymenobacter sp. ASUV-10]MDO7876959.1 response regulator transcription factor [Hymenobacter sp. ASUV-10]